MPFPNEHAARIKAPGKFARFRRQNDKFGSGIDVIWGISEDGSTEVQAIRFDKTKFTPSQAKEWLSEHDYKPILFEKATKAKEDAPNYRPSEFEDKRCSNCRFNIDGFCTLFNFNWDKGFICDAWEPIRRDSDVSEPIQETNEEEKATQLEGKKIFIMSFAELDKLRDAADQIRSIQQLTHDFNMLANDIMANPMIEDKSAAMQSLTDEFSERIEQPEGKKEFEELTECLDEKAVWTRAFINDLPDSSFLYIAPGGKKDGEGKTTPRTLRKFPVKNSTGKIDLPHLRNAIARIPQSNVPGLTPAKKDSLQEKAQKMLAKEGNKGILETVKGWIDELKALIVKPNDIKPEQPIQAIKTFKAKDGRTWIVVWSTNAFKDRDEEMFQTKAIEDFVERHADDEIKGEIWFWHLPKSKFADIKLQSVVGRFLVEAGPFDDSFVGRCFKNFFENNPNGHPTFAPLGWGASHGFKYNAEDRRDGIFKWFEKHESSVLPMDKASNQYNPSFSLKEGIVMNDAQRKEWEEMLGKPLVDAIVETGETKTAELEQSVEFKGEQPTEESKEEVVEGTKEDMVESATDVTEKPVVEETPVVEEKAITRDEIAEAIKLAVSSLREELQLAATEAVKTEISETVDGIMEIITPIAQKVAELSKSDETKIAQAVQDVPTASIASMVKNSLFGESAKIDGRTSYAKDKPQEAEVAGKYPSVQGVELKLWKGGNE